MIFTVGHSTRTAEEFVRLLQAFEVELDVDVRTIPRSRRNPQFESGALRKTLEENRIEYVHARALGGLRHPKRDSINTGWRNASFRGFADYMQTSEFAEAVDWLAAEAAKKRTAIMCAEAVPWRCHRSLISDALLVRGVEVIDILTESSSKKHKLTEWARVDGERVIYPAITSPSFFSEMRE
jgi:uncharacterized protein (DUF488 family)